MLSLLKNGNLALAFLLELAMLAALCYAGFVIGPDPFARTALGIGLPVVAILIWTLVGAPRSKWRWRGSGYLLLRVVLFGASAVLLFIAGQHILAIIFALLWVLNISFVYAWGQQ